MVAGLAPGSVQDQDAPGPQRGSGPVGDDDQRAGPGGEGLLGAGLGGGIEVAGRLVEDGDPGLRQVGTGQGDQLPFPVGQSRGIRLCGES